MTVRIVERVASVTREVDCPGCGRVLRFERSDIQGYRHDVEGHSGYIVCPNCGKVLDVPFDSGL